MTDDFAGVSYEKLKKNFSDDLQRLIGRECWGIVEGEGTGSVIDFDFGRKIPRDEPLDNEHLSENVRNFESEFDLFIKCVWRVDSNEKVLCGAWTNHQNVRRVMNKIIGQTVKEVILSEPAFDLTIIFSNGISLKVFSDQTNEVDRIDNYSFFTPEIIYTVGHQSNLTTSERD